jgi:urease accessory protein
MHVTVEPDAFLLLLPSPIQPYARSSYYQAQRIHLTSSSSSVILLDWFTAGRTRANDSDKVEEWDFERYSSLNEVVLDANVIMREKTVLENQSPKSEVNGRSRTIQPDMLADRMNPYQTYATILIYGPHFRSLLDALSALSQDPNQRQFQTQQPNGVLLWSFSLVEKERGGVLRLAGMETEVLAEFIRGVLERGKVDESVGRAMWERIW